MTLKSQPQSAKIYAFQSKYRATLSPRRDEAKPQVLSAPVRLPPTACGACWYHEDAILEVISDAGLPWKR